MAKKNTAIFSVAFSSHPFEKKMQAEKMGSSSPSLQGVKIQSEVHRSFWAGLCFPPKIPLIHQNEHHIILQKCDPPTKKNTKHKLVG